MDVIRDVFHKKRRTKRRLNSPGYFPRKVFVSDEKVANELSGLSLQDVPAKKSSLPTYSNSLSNRKPYYLSSGKNGERTFQDIEDSIDLEELDIDEDEHIEILPAVIQDIKFHNRKMLLRNVNNTPAPSIPPSSNPCTELVLWKPPDAMDNIMKILHNSNINNSNHTNSNSKPFNRRARSRKYAVTDVSVALPSCLSDDNLCNDVEDTFEPGDICGIISQNSDNYLNTNKEYEDIDMDL